MHPYFPKYLSMTPSIYDNLVRHIPVSRYDERLESERFTPREVFAHVADWEPILLSRMQTAYGAPGSAVMVLDEGELAEKNRYAHQDVGDSLRRFRLSRAETVAWLQGLEPEDYRRSYQHPEYGALTILDTAEMMAAHDLYHIEQLSQYINEKSVSTW